MLEAGIGPILTKKNIERLIGCLFGVNYFGVTLAFVLVFRMFYPVPSFF